MERATKDPAPRGAVIALDAAAKDDPQRSRRVRRQGSGADTPVFVGRDDVLGAVVRALADPDGRGAILHGQRRIGKTAVLQHLATVLPELSGHLAVYFDLADRGGKPLDEVLLDLARAIATPLALPEPTPQGDLGDFLRTKWLPLVLDGLPPGVSMVLLLDEMDAVPDAQDKQAAAALHPYLRRLLDSLAPRLSVVLALGREVDDLDGVARRFYPDMPLCRVSLLSREDAEALVRASGAAPFKPEAVDLAWDLTRGHPLLLQALCSHARPRGEAVETADVLAAIEPTLSRNRSAFEHIWKGLPPGARVVAAALAHAGAEAATEEVLHATLRQSGVSEIVRELVEAPALLSRWDLIEATAPKTWRFRVELLRRLVDRYKPLTAIKHELEQIEPAADRFFRHAESAFRSGNVETATARLRSALELNPNHGRASELLADILIAQKDWAAAREVLERLYLNHPAAARAKLVKVLLAAAEAAPDDQKLALYERARAVDKHNEAAIAAIDRLQLARTVAKPAVAPPPPPPEARVPSPPKPRTEPPPTEPALPKAEIPRPKTEPPRPKTEPPRPAASLEPALRKELEAEKKARAAAEALVASVTKERDKLLSEARAREADRTREADRAREADRGRASGNEVAALRKELEAEKRLRTAVEVRVGTLAAERDALIAESKAARDWAERESKAERERLAKESKAELERLRGEVAALALEQDHLSTELETITAERDRLRDEIAALRAPEVLAPPRPSLPELARFSSPGVPVVPNKPRPSALRRNAAPLAFLVVGLAALAVAYVMQPKQLELSAGSLTMLDRSDARRIEATKVLRLGKRRPATKLVWASADPKVATVSADGTITPAGTGTTRIEAREGRLRAAVDVTVSLPARIALTPAEITIAPDGKEVAIEARVLDGAGAPWKKSAALAWTSTAPAVAAVSGGKVRALAEGTATIEARLGDLVGRVEVTALGKRAAMEKGCAAGTADACVALARMLQKGEDGPADAPRAGEILQKACSAGALRACVEVASRHEEIADYPKAVALYQQACDGKDLLGCTRLARMYDTGIGVVGDSAKARELYKAACDANELEACWRLGTVFELGRGVAREPPAAATLYQKACDGGYAEACASLGNIRWNGSGSVPKDVPAAIALYEKACDAKHEPACTTLALKFKTGEGVDPSPQKSMVYFGKACAAGSKAACMIAPAPKPAGE
jgi:TPR repeat protein/tetratricopeptide (TPR) repeat protein